MQEALGNMVGYPEASRLLGVPVGTLYAWACQKRAPHIRLGPRAVRFNRLELERWLASKRVEGTP
jgi:excisionase family DNA binding protein